MRNRRGRGDGRSPRRARHRPRPDAGTARAGPRECAASPTSTIDFHEGDVEKLPFADAEFDVVLSQYGHMFAPRPDVAIAEMLRVLKPGGTIAFSTWPPELMVGRMFSLVGSYMPPPPPGVSAPPLWGDANVVRERLGERGKRHPLRPCEDDRTCAEPGAPSHDDGADRRSGDQAGRVAVRRRIRPGWTPFAMSTRRSSPTTFTITSSGRII